MRRFSASVGTAAFSVFAVSQMSAHSPSVVRNVVPAKVSSKLGVPATKEDVAKAHAIPAAILNDVENKRLIAFTEMDLVRTSFAPLINTVDNKTDYRVLSEEVAARLGPKPAVVKGALAKFKTTDWKDMKDVMTLYEEVLHPIRIKHNEFKLHQLTNYHIKDVLKRGLTAFKQDFLDEQKKQQVTVLAAMKECEDYIAAAAKEAFDTEVLNDIANVLRVAGEKYEHAHATSIRVLDEMTLMKIPYNNITHEIMRSVIFNDGPFDNSPLLFEVTEYPERGEVSLSKDSLEKVSGQILRLISNRHQTPLDDGVLLHSKETHPNLQRSPE